MVIAINKKLPRKRETAALMTELMVGVAILGIAVFPLAFSFAKEHQYLRSCYQRAVAMEIVDGEMEVLLAGDWHSFTNGVHQLVPRASAAAHLPPGVLQLTVAGKNLRLEWLPSETRRGGKVVREATAR
ncbi:MAG TPA: hypothetical protein VFZ59_11250 [Verrucomicrobiae bacterium]|nr:hypothetical protein [Verrucomicrobiae bacterium]